MEAGKALACSLKASIVLKLTLSPHELPVVYLGMEAAAQGNVTPVAVHSLLDSHREAVILTPTGAAVIQEAGKAVVDVVFTAGLIILLLMQIHHNIRVAQQMLHVLVVAAVASVCLAAQAAVVAVEVI